MRFNVKRLASVQLDTVLQRLAVVVSHIYVEKRPYVIVTPVVYRLLSTTAPSDLITDETGELAPTTVMVSMLDAAAGFDDNLS